MIMWPFCFIFSTMFNIANSISYPVIWFVREILAAPFRLVSCTSKFCSRDFFDDIVDLLRKTWSIGSSLYQGGSASRALALTSETTIWGSLWKDLYQILSAVRSILYGFVVFFSTCNRHRLRYPSQATAVSYLLRHYYKFMIVAIPIHHGCSQEDMVSVEVQYVILTRVQLKAT
uniref:ABC transmembrane type-1 domain-containing protein n=1 Tax=Aegilops tauschii subsp. strangulata TaxID=200361 RepID=A0A453JQJ9_AEGTS